MSTIQVGIPFVTGVVKTAAAVTIIAGLDGVDGADGADGAPGAPGVDGIDGTDGAPGLSAFQVAVANGFVGTEVEWLASLEGPAGQDGAPGTDGITSETITVLEVITQAAYDALAVKVPTTLYVIQD